jgi:hypothetical protein
MRIAPLVLAGVGALLGAGPAVAGPVWVTYRLDSYANPSPQGAAGDGRFDQHFSGRLAVGAESQLTEFRFLPLAPTPPGVVPADAKAPFEFDGVTRFAVKVQLTDDASGESGVVRLTGTATSSWMRAPDGKVFAESASFMFDAFPGELTLGSHRYEVHAAGGSSVGGEAVQAYVSVGLDTPGAAPSPEPGTLALAGVGVAGIAVAAARRRRG